jgi:hypothetical protein
MTDYNRWEKFDVNAGLQEVDLRAETEAAREARRKQFEDHARASENTIFQAKNCLEIMSSKVRK